MRKRDVRRVRWYVERNKFRRAWKRIAQVLACITVFCTTYALMLPAITLEMEPFCGIEDHEHVPSCYEPLPDFPEKQQTAMVIHSHSALCFDRAGTQICPFEELKAHQHSNDCYQLVISQHQQDVTGVPEALTHTHTAECYLVQRGTLVCSAEETQGHKHKETCFDYTDEPICELKEFAEHEHETACYVTGLLCSQEETEGHFHQDACYEMEEILNCGITTPEAMTNAPMETDTLQTETDSQMQESEQIQISPEEQEDTQTECAPETKPAEEITENRILVCEKQEYVEHSHCETCYETNETGEKYLICPLPQILAHQHSEACLSLPEEMLSCNSVDEAHQHTYECYTTWSFVCEFCAEDDGPQADADLETAQDWEKSFENVTLIGFWPEDVLAIAKTQLDYQESEKNYEKDGNGIRRGYTRYGQWLGEPYHDWNCAFVSFCLHYAEVAEFPLEDSCGSWIDELNKAERYASADGYLPKTGDLVFLDSGRTEAFEESEEETASMIADRVGIVAELVAPTEEEPAHMLVIEGDREDRVQEVSYELDSPEIVGYGNLPEAEEGAYVCGLVSHSHDWMCYDEAGIKSCGQEPHVHIAACKTRTVTYEDDLLKAELTLIGIPDLPEDLSMKILQITRDSDPDAFDAMYTALGDATLNSPFFISDAAFYRMELISGDTLWQIPEGTQYDFQVTLQKPELEQQSIGENAHLRTFALSEEESSEPVLEAPEDGDMPEQPMLMMAAPMEEEIPMDAAEEPQIRARYQAEETGTADLESETVTFRAENTATFGIALAATTREGNFWKRVVSTSNLTDDGLYLIVSAEGNYALTNADTNGTKVYLEPIKGNADYYEIKVKGSDGNLVDPKPQMQWTFSGSGNSYTIKNVEYNNYFVDLYYRWSLFNSTSRVIHNGTADALTLTYLTSEHAWYLKDERYLANSGSASFVLASDIDNPNTMLIFKLENVTLEIPDDVVSGSNSGSGTSNVPEKPEYPGYKKVTGSLSGGTAHGNVAGLYFSDPSTSQLEALFIGNTADNGKALSDKSVIYKKDDYDAFSNYPDNTFGVTLSALGQEYLVEEATTIKTPVDVVFVLDVSGSMKYSAGNVSRAEAMVSAVNSAIGNIMAQNDRNRVGVTLFSSGAWDLLELGQYYSSTNQYLYTTHEYMSKFSEERYQVHAYESIRAQVDQPVLETMDQANGTYTQAGIAKGAAMLERATSKSYTEIVNQHTDYAQSITVKRQPVIILLSDGEPTHCTSNYMDVLSGPHYGDGLANNGTYQGVYGYYTILSANYYKRMVGISYDNPVLFYTVGMGISETEDVDLSGVGADSDVYKRAVLNPTVENITDLSRYRNINPTITVDQLKALMENTCSDSSIAVTNGNQSFMSGWMGQVHANVPVLKNPYKTNYSYAEGAYFGQIDTNQLTKIFNEILLASYRVNSFGFILHNRSAMMIEDPIGVGMELKSDPILRYEGVNYTHTSTKVEGNKTTYVYDYDYTATDGSRQEADLSTVVVEVIEDDTGQQTVHLHIPDAILPAYSPCPYVDKEGNIPFYYEALPIRLIYQVGLTEESEQEIAQLENYGGQLTYYTNRCDEETFAHTDMTPTNKNPYYKPGSENDHDHSLDKTTNTTNTDPHSFECHHDREEYDGEVVPVIRQDLGNNGKLVFSAERKVIDIPVEKRWQDSVPEDDTTVDIELYSVVDDTATLVATMTLGQQNQWMDVFEGLPLLQTGGYYALRELVPAGFVVSYTGEIVEIPLNGKPTRVVKIQGQKPITEELVTVTNLTGYVLPDTGDVGTYMYTFSGLFLILAALVYGYSQRRKCERRGG